jgi:integrase
MLGKRAKILSDDNIRDLLAFASLTRYPTRNRVMVLLSVKAGLRAGEIANLTWAMVTDPVGDIGTVIAVEDRIAKKKSGRVIPLHPDLRDALATLGNLTGSNGPVISQSATRRWHR